MTPMWAQTNCLFFSEADTHHCLVRVDSGSCIEGQKNHESREAKTGTLSEVPLIGVRAPIMGPPDRFLPTANLRWHRLASE